MDISAARERHAFSVWLRTGRRPRRSSGDIELKFNPYHDPRNGRFTFAPGCPRSVGDDGAPATRDSTSAALPSPYNDPVPSRSSEFSSHAGLQPTSPLDPSTNMALLQPPMAPGLSRTGRGSNIRAFQDPMTLEQVSTGLNTSPGGAIIALADNVLDIFGPSQAANAELTQNWTRMLLNQIKEIDPHYRFDSLGEPRTQQGQINQLNRLRFDRAAAFLRVRSELRPLQVETWRFIQEQANLAYDRGKELLRKGRLKVYVSPELSLGNYIDREVRSKLRERYNQYGINSAGAGPVRVNRRENITSGSELTYRRPDARVGNVAFDVTLTAKSLKTAQVRGFFAADFKPDQVVIIRPYQVGQHYTYVISRPEKK